MATPVVLHRLKAEIVKVLEESGHSASAFLWSDDPSKHLHDSLASTISYKSEEYYFRIDRNANSIWVVTYCPSDKKWTFGPDGFSYWERVLGHAKQWAGYVAGELEAKSYLAVAMNNPQLLRLPEPNDENAPFSKLEQEQLIERLDRIEEQLLGLRENDDIFRIEVGRNLQCLRNEVAAAVAPHFDTRYSALYFRSALRF